MARKYELFDDLTSRGNDFQSSAWSKNNGLVFSDFEQGLAPSIFSQDLASIYLSNSLNFMEKRQSVFPGSLAGATVTIGGWVRAPVITGSGSFNLILGRKDFMTEFGKTIISTSISSLQLVRFTHTFSIGFTDSGFGIQLRLLEPDSGDAMSIWRGHAFFDPSPINLTPQYDFQRLDDKIEDIDISKTGKRFVYTWGERWKNRFGVTLVNSSVFAVVNGWWRNNNELLWIVDCGLDVRSVHVSNRDMPISGFVKPHNNLFKGVIELETY